MRTWKYQDPSGEYTLTDDEILEFYYSEWAKAMVRAGKRDKISKENCIQDFVVVHWAWEVKADV